MNGIMMLLCMYVGVCVYTFRENYAQLISFDVLTEVVMFIAIYKIV